MKKLGYRKKVCRRCGQYLYLGQFYKDKKTADGRSCYCRECGRELKKESYNRTRKVKDGLKLNKDGRLVIKDGCSSKLYWGTLKTNDFKRRFPRTENEILAIDFEVSVRTVVRRARSLGLEKDPDWLKSKWDKNREIAHAVNKICGVKYDYDQLMDAGMPYRFKKKKKQQTEYTNDEATTDR